jgi:hypothetical protein
MFSYPNCFPQFLTYFLQNRVGPFKLQFPEHCSTRRRLNCKFYSNSYTRYKKLARRSARPRMFLLFNTGAHPGLLIACTLRFPANSSRWPSIVTTADSACGVRTVCASVTPVRRSPRRQRTAFPRDSTSAHTVSACCSPIVRGELGPECTPLKRGTGVLAS